MSLKLKSNQNKLIKPPIITSMRWGEIKVNYKNKEYKFKDCILTPNSVKNWNWKLDKTNHDDGIKVQGIKKSGLINKNIDYILLTNGCLEAIKKNNQTKHFLNKAKTDKKIKNFRYMETRKGVKYYNKAVNDGKKIAGLFHSTC